MNATQLKAHEKRVQAVLEVARSGLDPKSNDGFSAIQLALGEALGVMIFQECGGNPVEVEGAIQIIAAHIRLYCKVERGAKS